MKTLYGVIVILFLSVSLLRAQTSIETTALKITCNKTTHLIFPAAVKAVDRGSPAVLVQRVKGVENMLKVKAAKPGFAQSNLSVITADGKLYSFVVDFQNEPIQLNYQFAKDNIATAVPVTFTSNNLSETDFLHKAGILRELKHCLNGVKETKDDMSLHLLGIYIDDEVMYFKLSIKNSSPINYDVESIRFFIQDKKKARRRATQENEIIPLYQSGSNYKINAIAKEEYVFAVPKFTLSVRKRLVIEMTEKNGGRYLHVKVGNKRIMKAISLVDLK